MESQRIENLKNFFFATSYYLYRQAGCPFGDSSTGFHLWLNTNIKQPFEVFCRACEEQENKE